MSAISRILVLLTLIHGAFGAGLAPADLQFFEAKVRPVLVEHCYECHSATAKKVRGNLLLDTKAGWEKGGDSGEPAIIPGHPERSLLVRSIEHLDDDLKMPPKKPKLPAGVIADLTAWVKMGAPDPRDGTVLEARRADKSWWSLQPLAHQFHYDDIDSFIDEALSAQALHQNPPANPRELIRRMSYDVLGLPPTPEEVDAFIADFRAAPDPAVERLVDRLLASPRYGERWGRHWLDVVRFGESNGFERNQIVNDAWPFRDYVIRSLNEDKPIDQLVVEHLAGDVIGKDQPEVEVGSAFLVAGPYDDVGNQDPVAQKNIRAATLDEIVTATAGAFLGLTVNCARCHNHKFDPIPTEDYYRLRSAFEGVRHGRRTIATREQRQAYSAAVAAIEREARQVEAAQNVIEAIVAQRAGDLVRVQRSTRPKIDPDYTEETFAPVQARYVRFSIDAVTGETGRGDPAALTRGRLSEFEVWSAEGRNVALAANGGHAEGAKSMRADDFPEAYGPQLCIDGQRGEQWFIGVPAVLTIVLAQPATVQRVAFTSAKGEGGADNSRGAAPCEYRIEVSMDGEHWTLVASDDGREPWSHAHALDQARRLVEHAAETAQIDAYEKQLSALRTRRERVTPLPMVWAGNFAEIKDPSVVDKGGDPLKPASTIQPASLSVLDRVTTPYQLEATAAEGQRRLALARWITAADNPLTPRVLANRLWHYHFGIGLVDTPSDFGFLGSKPTHPALLDFLAQRLLAHGWRLKPVHREILLSRTYRQSGAYREAAGRVDQGARLLWRFPPRRLSAEELRDTWLTVAGKLQVEPMGGPGFRLYRYLQNNVSTYVPLEEHGPETYRRAVYHQSARASVVDLLSDFDFPDIAFAAPKRANTTTPLQALTLLNHGFTLDMAGQLASRLSTTDPVGDAYRLVFQRAPRADEREAAQSLVIAHGALAFCRALLNSNELLYLE